MWIGIEWIEQESYNQGRIDKGDGRSDQREVDIPGQMVLRDWRGISGVGESINESGRIKNDNGQGIWWINEVTREIEERKIKRSRN